MIVDNIKATLVISLTFIGAIATCVIVALASLEACGAFGAGN